MAMASANVLLLPEAGSGHLMSLIEAGKRLLAHGGRGDGEGPAVTVTVLVVRPATSESAAEVDAHVGRVEASGLGVRFHRLPAVEPPMGCAAGNVQEFKSRYMQLQAPHVKAAAEELGAAALVVDFFATGVLDAAREAGVPTYVYFTSTAALLALMLRLPALEEEVPVDFEEFDGTVDVPGLPPVPAGSLPAFMGRKESPNFRWFVYHGRRFMDADGIIINTVAELEPALLAAIADGRCVPGRRAPRLYPIGPVLDLEAKPSSNARCVRWLDAQPPASVLFLCFGSMGWFDAAKAREVAAGLERSGHRFLWVLRGPPAAGAVYPTDASLDELLPEGFLERTKERGLVWPTWAPQKEILAHAAIGGFVTHCGWNSTLESLWHGVPLVPWPLYAEQRLNALELVRDMGVAVPLRVDRERDNFVEAAELERAVRSLMGGGASEEEGRKAREKAAEMKAVCRNAMAAGGGSSYAALRRLLGAIRRGAPCSSFSAMTQ
uniref:Glycosyltransferase n=1 Tax=Oryza meridionalis TaxID=40149 RepID=A0A0E0EBN6_9ORYZ